MADRPASGLTVRPVRAGEEERLRALRVAALQDAPEAFCTTLERERTRQDFDRWIDGGGVFLLVTDEDQPVGLAGGTPGREDHPEEMFVQSVWIAPAWRGRGGIEPLIEAVLGWGREQGYTTASLHVGHRSPAARRVYERLGFRPNGDDFHRERDDILEQGMSRPLD